MNPATRVWPGESRTARPLEFPDLVAALTREHGELRRRFKDINAALDAGNRLRASALTRDLCDDLRQHIIDEEARVLRLLIDTYGRQGAGEAIKVFQKHRPIRAVIKAMEQIPPKTPEALRQRTDELERLLLGHLVEEEERVFPWALETYERTKGR